MIRRRQWKQNKRFCDHLSPGASCRHQPRDSGIGKQFVDTNREKVQKSLSPGETDANHCSVLDSLPIESVSVSVTCQRDANCDCETVEDNPITDTNRGAVQVGLRAVDAVSSRITHEASQDDCEQHREDHCISVTALNPTPSDQHSSNAEYRRRLFDHKRLTRLVLPESARQRVPLMLDFPEPDSDSDSDAGSDEEEFLEYIDSLPRECAQCGVPEGWDGLRTVTLGQCMLCRVAFYCSKACQEGDWKYDGHRDARSSCLVAKLETSC
jgi:hypothetical protein